LLKLQPKVGVDLRSSQKEFQGIPDFSNEQDLVETGEFEFGSGPDPTVNLLQDLKALKNLLVDHLVNDGV
jgi:hypothetical protein